jgi:hypothetical protein
MRDDVGQIEQNALERWIRFHEGMAWLSRGASMRSIGRFGFLRRTRCAIALAEEAQKSDPDLKFIRKSGGCRPRGRHVGSL